MGLDLFDNGLIRVTVRYVKQLKSGAPYSYYRAIPLAVQAHYDGKRHIRRSLQTRSLAEAARKALKITAELDARWNSLRSREGYTHQLTTPENRLAASALLAEWGLQPGALAPSVKQPDWFDAGEILDPYFTRRYGEAYVEERQDPRSLDGGERFFNAVEREAMRQLREDPRRPSVLLSDALARYLEDHNKGNQPKFITDTKRSISHVVSAVGDLPLTDYQREHATRVREDLLSSGNKTTTARRRLNVIRAVFNKGLIEFNLRSHGNPFESLPIAREARDADTREAFTTAELQTISKAGRGMDDDIRHIVSLQADTGARLGEVVGLRINDVVLDHETPHILIRPHEALGRTLKNAHSERSVPLLGDALWAAQKALQAVQTNPRADGWLFPRYAQNGSVNATGASNTINRWLSKTLKIPKTSHSFRHAMRDRLRHAGVSDEFQNLLGGWGSRTVGQRYGQGYLLSQLRDELSKAVQPTSSEQENEASA